MILGQDYLTTAQSNYHESKWQTSYSAKGKWSFKVLSAAFLLLLVPCTCPPACSRTNRACSRNEDKLQEMYCKTPALLKCCKWSVNFYIPNRAFIWYFGYQSTQISALRCRKISKISTGFPQDCSPTRIFLQNYMKNMLQIRGFAILLFK